MKDKKDASIFITCSQEERDYIKSKAINLNITMSNLLINGANVYGSINPMTQNNNKIQLTPIKLKQLAELSICIKDLGIKYPELEDDLYEIEWRCKDICLH